MKETIKYALTSNGKIVSINEAERGLNCNCLCIGCKQRLIAKKGKKQIHHFAHYNAIECGKSNQTLIHLKAKDILLKAKKIKLPDLYIEFPNSGKNKELIKSADYISIDHVILEKKLDSIIPDIIVISNNQKLIIEVVVTHDIDDEKFQKIKKMNIPTLKIDLSKKEELTDKELEKNIIDNLENKTWIFNRLSEKYYNLFKYKAKPFEPNHNRKGVYCPQNLYGWGGHSSAKLSDCYTCKYCFCIEGPNNCLGYAGISTLEDLKKGGNPPAKLTKKPSIWFEDTLCEKCKKGYMKKKISKHGTFLGCSNYPNCKNTIKL